jgi:hypothetical protein
MVLCGPIILRAARGPLRDPPLDRFAQISPMSYGCADASGTDAFTPHPGDEANGLTGRAEPQA